MIQDYPYTHSAAEFAEIFDLAVGSYAHSRQPWNWRVAMLENWSYASRYLEPLEYFTSHVHLWREESGQLAGCLIHYYHLIFPQVSRQHRSLEDAMFVWAEQNWAGESKQIATFVFEHDLERQELLARRGYADRGRVEVVRLYDLGHDRTLPSLPAGFRFAARAELGEAVEEYLALENAIWGRTSLDEAWFRGKSSAPHYSLDWDLAVLSPEGRQVGACLAWLDWQHHLGEIDPLGVHPDYRRLGLARALCLESFGRMRQAGMQVACIASEAADPLVDHLYASLEPDETYYAHEWVKNVGE
ncbi:MAG: GNAT family N-acetyltransferase [Anaerolineales bacterium]|nr:GNAT family N-acetyltransferase [Anaerolineales bacterium]